MPVPATGRAGCKPSSLQPGNSIITRHGKDCASSVPMAFLASPSRLVTKALRTCFLSSLLSSADDVDRVIGLLAQVLSHEHRGCDREEATEGGLGPVAT